MAVRILENNGIDNTNIDGASFNNFCAGQRSGIIKGRLNECAITSPSSSVVNVDTGELIIFGSRIVIDSTNFTFSTFPSTATRYSLVAEIVIDDSSEITQRIFVQLASVALTQNDLYKTATGAGTYQIELAKFTLSTSGVIDLIRTVDIITGGTGSGGSTHWEVGEIVTETLDVDIPAEVDIDYNEDTEKYDFNFGIPQGEQGIQGFKGDTGATGAGVAIGGTTGQILKKKSATDYDTEWGNEYAGDDKVDKTTSGSVRRVYGISSSNTQELTEVEATPTASSTKLVTSGGIKTALDAITKSSIGLGNVYNPTAYGGISYGGGDGESGISFTDLNSLTYSGFYTCFGTTANVPSSLTSWFIEHINSNVGTATATQFAYAYDDNKVIYKRTKTSGTWGSWENISPSLKENVINKVTSISSSSTDTQYPTAKCMYDIIGNIETLLAEV